MDREPIADLVESGAPAPVETPAPETPPTPETPPKEETPANPTPENPPVDPAAPVLYETPDGRMVDAETLTKEWKENFLPEFTRKSQRLAELEGGKDLNNPPAKEEPAWKKPDYVPQSYAEVIEIAQAEALAKLKGEAEAETARVAAIHTEVDNQLNEVKKLDPKVDEEALFTHANKYGFRDLKTAYLNMTDMKNAVVTTEQRTVKNLKTREADPIAGAPGGEITEEDGYDPKSMGQFDSAAEYYAHLKAQGKK